MANTFFISDTHFGHDNTWKLFKNNDGTPLRPFTSTEEMNEAMISNWNRVVGQYDKVYHLGDVVINRKFMDVVGRLNGKKCLVRGNHDIFKLEDYTKYFYDVRGVHVMSDMILSHVPLHRESITSRFGTNVHGHLHGNRVMRTNKFHQTTIDPIYYSVCVEQIGFTPISIDDLRKNIASQKAAFE